MKKKFISMILVLNIISSVVLTPGLPVTATDDKFIDNPNWIETRASVVDTKFNNNESFVVMFFRTSCFNSNLRKTIVTSWLNDYDINVYGVDVDTYNISSWAWSKLTGTSVSLPVICIVKNKQEYSAFPAQTSMNNIQRSLHELLGVYDESAVDFYTLNSQIYNSYNTTAANAANFLKPRNQIDSSIVVQSDAIVAGLTDNYQKILAIHDWVAENIFYDYDLYNQMQTGSPNPYQITDVGTLQWKASVCSGYANLTASLCQAAGIPCRYKRGFALGVGSDNTVMSVWNLYQSYIQNRNLDTFASTMSGYSNHAWNEAYVDGRWIIMDTTWDSNNDRYGTGIIYGDVDHTYFDSDIRAFSSDHLFWIKNTGDNDNNIVLLSDYANKLSVYIEQDGNTVTLGAKVLEGTSVDLSRLKFYIAQYDNGNLIGLQSPVGMLNVDGYTKYSGTLPTDDYKLFYLTDSMEPVIEPILPII